MRQIIRKCKWIILGIFVMFLAVCTMRKLYEDTPVEYCKNIISCKNGYAAVFEDDWAISVVTFNDNGVIEQKAVKLHNNPFLVKEHNYRTVFEENGDIYIMGCVYSSDSKNVQWRVEKCDFTTGTFTTEWVLAQREGYSFVSGNIPRVIDGNLYVIYQEESTKDAVTFKVTPDDKYEIVSRTSIPDGAMLEKTVYTSDGTFAITTSYGMFLGDERIYPKKKNDKCMLSGIGYTDDTVSVIDINTSEMVVYSAKDKKINKTAFIMGEYSKYQSVRINSDKSITCSYEDGENLYGCYAEGEKNKVFRSLQEENSWKFALKKSIKIELIYILAVVFLIFINKLIKKKNGVEKDKNFIGLSMKTTIVSVIIMTVSMVFFGPKIYYQFFLINDEWKQKNLDSTAVDFASFMADNIKLEIKDGMPWIKDKDYKVFVKMMNHYTELVQASGKSAYDICVFTTYNDEIYCIYTAEFSGSSLAEYAVSRNVVDACRITLNDFQKVKYNDRRSIGRFNYYNHPFYTYMEDGEVARLAISVVTDGYRDQLQYYHMVPQIIAAILAMDILFIVIINLFINRMLRRLRRLSLDLREYNETKNPECISLGGNDEIGQTAQAIKTMAQGLEIYTKDLNESNANYRKLLSTGILYMMGHERISQVKLNESVEKPVSVIYVSFYGKNRNILLEKIIECAEQNCDKIVEFTSGKMCIVIVEPDKKQQVQQKYKELSAEYSDADIEFAEEERIFASVGNSEKAYLVSMKKQPKASEGEDLTDDK